MTQDHPVRILHVVGGMNRGGVETWLMNVLRNIDRERYHMDFLVHTDQPRAYDDEVRALGSRIIPCLHPDRPLRYARRFTQVLREYGPYDVVHSHVHHYSGIPLMLARRAGVPIRIAHSHNDTSRVDRAAGRLRRLYLQTMEGLIRVETTCGLACSQPAAAALFGVRWANDQRIQVLHYGIDLTPFRQALAEDRCVVRRQLGLPDNAIVVGHVGRFAPQKNHRFLIEIFAEILRHEPRAHLLLVGDGPLRPQVYAQVCALGLNDHVTFAGLRGDVPRLMVGAMDVFLFPSFYEGLSLVLVEAQAAGLRCVVSDVIPTEADIVPLLVQRMPLQASASVWADIVVGEASKEPADSDRALCIVEQGSFSIRQNLRGLEAVYGR